MADREERVLAWIARHSAGRVREAAGVVTLLGETPVVWVAVAVASLAALHDGRRGPAVRALLTLASASALRHSLAQLVNRDRPPRPLWRAEWTGPSFPSRHTTMAGLGAGLVVETLTADHCAGLTAACVAGSLVGASRLVLGVHWPTDVLGGCGFMILVLRLSYGHRLHRHPPHGQHRTPTQPGRRRGALR